MAPLPLNLQAPILLAQSPGTNSPSTLSPSSSAFPLPPPSLTDPSTCPPLSI